MAIFPQRYILWKYGYFSIFFGKQRSPYVINCTEMNLLLNYLVIEMLPSFLWSEQLWNHYCYQLLETFSPTFKEKTLKTILHTSSMLVVGNINFSNALCYILTLFWLLYCICTSCITAHHKQNVSCYLKYNMGMSGLLDMSIWCLRAAI